MELIAATRSDVMWEEHGSKWVWHVLMRVHRRFHMVLWTVGSVACRTADSRVCPETAGFRPCETIARILWTGTWVWWVWSRGGKSRL